MPFSDALILGDVIYDNITHQQQSENGEEQQENIVGADKFLLEVLRICHRIKNLSLYMHEISDRAGEYLVLCRGVKEEYFVIILESLYPLTYELCGGI